MNEPSIDAGEAVVGTQDLSDSANLRATWADLLFGLLVFWAVLVVSYWVYNSIKQPLSVDVRWIAASVCGTAGTLAYWIVWFTRGTCYSMEGMLGSMLFRTVIPLVSVPCVAVLLPDSNQADIFENFVVFYLLTLFMETLLSVHLTKKFDERVASLADNKTSQ